MRTNNGKAGVVAWSLCGLSFAFMIATLALLWAGADAGARPSLLEERTNAAISTLVLPTTVVVGAVIAAHRSRNVVGWLLLANGLAQTVSVLAGEYAFYSLIAEPGSLPGGGLMSVVYGVFWTTNLTAIGLGLLLFPDGRLPSRRWLPVGLLAMVPTLFVPLGAALVWPYRGIQLLTESLPEERSGIVDPLIGIVILTAIPAVLLAGISLFFRFRRGSSIEKQQIKWLAIAAFALFLDGVTSEIFSTDALWRYAISALAFSFVPVAIGLAVFRYRLYDVDRIINRAIVYTGLSVILAFGYAGAILVLQALLPLPDRSPAIVAASTLLMAALFAPARRRLQNFVDRRFYRSRFDSIRALESFGARLRRDADLDEVTRTLAEAARTTMQPATVSVWVRPVSSR